MKVGLWDNLRGFAVLGILAVHFQIFLKPYTGFQSEFFFNSPLAFGKFIAGLSVEEIFILLGGQGVGLFLILSGAGLTYSLLKNNRTIDVRWIYRRVLRIIPGYWFALLSSPMLLVQSVPGSIFFYFAGLNVFFPELFYFPFNQTLWFIPLIIQAYLLFPFLFWLGKKIGFGKLYFVSIGVSFLFSLFAMAVSSQHFYFFTGFILARLSEFVFGMLVAFLTITNKQKFTDFLKKPSLLFFSMFLFFIFFVLLVQFYDLVLFFYSNVASVLWFLVCSSVFLWLGNNVVIDKVLGFFSDNSWGFFLLHGPLMILLARNFQNDLPFLINLVVFILLISPIVIIFTRIELGFSRFMLKTRK